MKDKSFTELFPWPEDRPLRRARFGDRPAKGGSLPDPKDGHEDGHACRAKHPWFRVWQDVELGLHVRVELHPDSGEVWAFVRSPRTDYLGKAVFVGLVGEQENQLLRITVPLNEREPDGAEGCRGSGLLGSLENLSDQAGSNPDLAVFLLE